MTDQTAPFETMLAAYRAAVLAKDVDAFVALYDEDVRVFDMWGSWSLRGTAAWRAMTADWFGSLGDERVLVVAYEVESTVAGEMAIGHAILSYAAVDAEGRTLRSLNNRITMALRRSDGAWKIIHEHTSAPVDHQSLKAILHYEAGG
ncbi:nuclear transport factor 2 family protein [Neisseriaceae bacterium JH1-16]|nr:nuclear transport factor 2 family protein [Neisseriaceae bacterium JH1-16]